MHSCTVEAGQPTVSTEPARRFDNGGRRILLHVTTMRPNACGDKHMKVKVWLYRIAAMVSILFVAGHTYGFLSFQAPNEDGRKVWAGMNSVHFAIGGRAYSYGGFYIGFGLIISAAVLFLAALMWWLGNRSRDGVNGLRGITWLLAAFEAVVLGLSLRFFGAGPAALSAITAVLLAGAAVWKTTDAGI